MANQRNQLAIFMLLLAHALDGNAQEDNKIAPPANWEIQNVENFLGYENCRKCHQLQVEKLVATAHFKSYETTHRSAESKAICQQVGIRSIKRSDRCIRCHYTPEISTRGIRASSGISCESCHGSSKNWIVGHNDYGGLNITKEQESSAHKKQRVESSIAKGMRHPSNLYLLAKSCYECHLIDDPQLINETIHPQAAKQFNMVSWSQGNMRHNFLRTDNKYNAKSTDERLRVMFVVDLMARLEAVLKSAAKSKPDTKHFGLMNSLYQDSAKELLNVSKLVENAYIDSVIDVLKKTPPDANKKQKLGAAKSISNIAFEFGKNETAHALDEIQNLLPAEETYR